MSNQIHLKSNKICINKSLLFISGIVVLIGGFTFLAYTASKQNVSTKSKASEILAECYKSIDPNDTLKEDKSGHWDYVLKGDNCDKCGQDVQWGPNSLQLGEVDKDNNILKVNGCAQFCIDKEGDAPAMCPKPWPADKDIMDCGLNEQTPTFTSKDVSVCKKMGCVLNTADDYCEYRTCSGTSYQLLTLNGCSSFPVPPVNPNTAVPPVVAPPVTAPGNTGPGAATLPKRGGAVVAIAPDAGTAPTEASLRVLSRADAPAINNASNLAYKKRIVKYTASNWWDYLRARINGGGGLTTDAVNGNWETGFYNATNEVPSDPASLIIDLGKEYDIRKVLFMVRWDKLATKKATIQILLSNDNVTYDEFGKADVDQKDINSLESSQPITGRYLKIVWAGTEKCGMGNIYEVAAFETI